MMYERNRETSSTPSLTPSLSQPPTMVLNPRAEELKLEHEDSAAIQKKRTKGVLKENEQSISFKMRNYSVMTKKPDTKASQCMRDYLSKVLQAPKSGHHIQRKKRGKQDVSAF